MPGNIEVLSILVFLIPGFISSAVLKALVVREGKQGELQGILEALVFSMLVYSVYSLFGRKPVSLDPQNIPIYDPISLLLLTGLSLVFPILVSTSTTNDWHMRFARCLRITSKTARPSTWVDVFADIDRFVVVNFKDGRRILGWPEYYSDDPERPYVYLTSPHRLEGEEPVDTGHHGILITPGMEIEYIEFVED